MTKMRHKSDGEQHGGVKANLAADQGADPVKGLDGGGDANGHGEDREGKRRIWAHAAHKHVVSPNAEPQNADGRHGVNHGAVAKNRLAREGGEDVGSHAHARKDGDVNLGVSEEPEQVLPEQRRAAGMRNNLVADDQAAWDEETGAAHAIEQQQEPQPPATPQKKAIPELRSETTPSR